MPSKSFQVKKLLDVGYPAREVAKMVGCSERWVYGTARRNKLPTNPPVGEGSPVETEIALLLFAGVPLDEVAARYRHAPASIHSIAARVKARYGNSNNPRRQPGEAPFRFPTKLGVPRSLGPSHEETQEAHQG